MGKFVEYNHSAESVEEAVGEGVDFKKVVKVALKLRKKKFDSISETAEYVEKKLNKRELALLAVKMFAALRDASEMVETMVGTDTSSVKDILKSVEKGSIPKVGVAGNYEGSDMPDSLKDLLRRAESGDMTALTELEARTDIDINVRRVSREEAKDLGIDVDGIEAKVETNAEDTLEDPPKEIILSKGGDA